MQLVTGASGFVGRHLVRHLSRQGHEVRALYHSSPPSADLAVLPGVEWQKADLLDVFDIEECMKDVTEIYHCAAIVSFDPRQREKMLHFNPESTANLVNQALLQDVRKMVYVSSVAALGRTGKAGKEIDEEQEWGESNYNSAYGLSKYLAETEVWRGIGEGLNAVIVNPGIILGDGDWTRGSAQLMSVAYREFPFYTGGITSWVDIEDVVQIICMLMDADTEAERYIVSAGNFAYREIFTLMANALNKRPPRFRASSFITGLAWRWDMLQSSLGRRNAAITKETASSANSINLYSNTKLLSAFPAFSYTPINVTIEKMARSFMYSLY